MGLLLARRGVQVLALERRRDFAREYRGEVLMPRGIRLLREVGFAAELEGRPARRLEAVEVHYGARRIARLPIASLCADVPYALWIPQPELLAALHAAAQREPTFRMWFGAEVRELRREGDAVRGLHVRRDDAMVEIDARVVVGADGRFSVVRRLLAAPMAYAHHDFDVLWFTVPEPAAQPAAFRAYLTASRAWLALPKHPAAVQCGIVVPPGGFADLRARGIENLRRELCAGPAVTHAFAAELRDFAPFVLLAATTELVAEWARDGCLLIGDAAHTCSPVGAVGVSVAMETAVVAADVIAGGLACGDVSARALDEVQRQREAVVRDVHRRQRRVARLAGRPSPWSRRLLALGAAIGMRLPFGRGGLRRLLVGDRS